MPTNVKSLSGKGRFIVWVCVFLGSVIGYAFVEAMVTPITTHSEIRGWTYSLRLFYFEVDIRPNSIVDARPWNQLLIVKRMMGVVSALLFASLSGFVAWRSLRRTTYFR